MTSIRRGISLIELTIVILILGITAAIATPRLADTLRHFQLEAAAVELAAHLRQLRNQAINESRTTTLICDNAGNRYRSDDLESPPGSGQRLDVSLAEAYDPAFSLTASFDKASSISFDFEGSPTVAGAPLESGSIRMSYRDVHYQVMISAGSGQIDVQRVQSSSEVAQGETGHPQGSDAYDGDTMDGLEGDVP